jgi:F0F1-type ATP synthase membrane subunit b/b'
MQGRISARLDTKQEDMLVRMREYIKSGQAEMSSTIGSIEERMEATIQSTRSEVQETIQHRMENVRAEINKKKRRASATITNLTEVCTPYKNEETVSSYTRNTLHRLNNGSY